MGAPHHHEEEGEVGAAPRAVPVEVDPEAHPVPVLAGVEGCGRNAQRHHRGKPARGLQRESRWNRRFSPPESDPAGPTPGRGLCVCVCVGLLPLPWQTEPKVGHTKPLGTFPPPWHPLPESARHHECRILGTTASLRPWDAEYRALLASLLLRGYLGRRWRASGPRWLPGASGRSP